MAALNSTERQSNDQHVAPRRSIETGGPKSATAIRMRGDGRFRQLHTLAGEGNPEAAADLWREYGFLFGEDQP
jgi:hypothetical protein